MEQNKHDSPADPLPFQPDLSKAEIKEAKERSTIRPHVVHEAVRLEGEEELRRSTAALAWSGFAAGLSMGFSLIGQGLLRACLPDQPWRPLITNFGYSLGFVVVVLGRQQLFTENTLTAVLPLLARRNLATLGNVMRLWWVVFVANMLGALLVAWVLGNTPVFEPRVRHVFGSLSHEVVQGSFGDLVLRGIFAGWLIALMVWLLPAAETGRLWIIMLLTYTVGLSHFPHIIAGGVEVLYGVTTGSVSWGAYAGGWMVPTLIGNIIGGVALVSVINHAQVIAGRKKAL